MLIKIPFHTEYERKLTQTPSEDDIVSRSGSPTPRNSPRTARSILMGIPPDLATTKQQQQQQLLPQQQSSAQQPLTSRAANVVATAAAPPSSSSGSAGSSSAQIKNQKFADSLEMQSDSSQPGSPPDSIYDAETRVVTMVTKKSTNLGISLMGGNAVGIYVHDVQSGSMAESAGMRKGDQVLYGGGKNIFFFIKKSVLDSRI